MLCGFVTTGCKCYNWAGPHRAQQACGDPICCPGIFSGGGGDGDGDGDGGDGGGGSGGGNGIAKCIPTPAPTPAPTKVPTPTLPPSPFKCDQAANCNECQNDDSCYWCWSSGFHGAGTLRSSRFLLLLLLFVPCY